MAQVSNFPHLRRRSTAAHHRHRLQKPNSPSSHQNAAVFGEQEDPHPFESQFACEDDDSDQMNFITELFSRRHQYPHPNFPPFGPEPEFRGDLGSGDATQLGQLSNSEVPRGLESSVGGLRVVGFESDSESEGLSGDKDLELGLGLGFGDATQLGQLSDSEVPGGFDSSIGGLRVIGLESDSDSEGFVRDDDPFGDPGVPIFWDGSGFEEGTSGVDREFEWEEVEEQSVFERDGLRPVIDRIEELSVSSEMSNMEGGEMGDGVEEERHGDLEWEFLLAVNNLERNLEFENESFGEYDELFGQLMENGADPKGSPPTAKSVVESLPVVVLSEEELREEGVACAVCKDDISTEDRVTRLPCRHFYHGDCIVPWLCMRNTCPVCRYELPTDDLEYERRKDHDSGVSLTHDLLVRYTFQPIW